MSDPARPSGDAATVTVHVAVEPSAAFEVFTQEIDLWWRRGPGYRRVAGGGVVCIEPGVGGRVFEAGEGGRVHEMGRVLVWSPPRRLVLEWRNANFAPGEKTKVDVSFEPAGDGTRVTVVHSGWASLRPDHPARHGLVGGAFAAKIGQWWGGQMTALRAYAGERAAPDGGR
jgi:uncharacterized protein YndB with AHSA1/START domain